MKWVFVAMAVVVFIYILAASTSIGVWLYTH